MKTQPLTPLEQIVDRSEPNQVHFQITVNWPNAEPSNYIGMGVSLEQAAERFEILAEELRGAVGSRQEATS